MIWQIASQRIGDRGAKLPIKRGEQVMIQYVPVDAHVIHELGDISTLPRQHEFSGCVVHTIDSGAQLVTGTH